VRCLRRCATGTKAAGCDYLTEAELEICQFEGGSNATRTHDPCRTACG
jgi:hypothetical protein